ncbi:MAG TPA: feruloyl-CoA synthase [Polyangiaceae bacterium]|nr:feruloyl-CoA synthase [Polyangiaceae bacterium]
MPNTGSIASDDPRELASMFAPPAVEEERRADGAILLRSSMPLGGYARCTGEYLEHWALTAPSRPFLLERSPSGEFQGVTYAEALAEARRVGAWLLERELSAQRPVVILSENSVQHGLLTLASLHVGIPVAPVSPAYSLMSQDFKKLKTIVQTLQPGLIYVSDCARFAAALAAVRDLHDASIVAGSASSSSSGLLSFGALRPSQGFAALDRAFAAISPDTIAKFLFTSGSADEPKGVINTQRMLCSNQQAIAQVWPFIREPPVLVDWLPWHHTFGGNHNFNMMLRNGGTLYIDSGRPIPGDFEQTLANLREVAPSVYFNVPRGYDFLVSALRDDRALREHFFSRLRLIFYAAASLPQSVWETLDALALQTLGRRVPMVSAWGSTETAPAATSCHYQADRSGVIGVPLPGCELKLVPNGEKLEARVRGPNVTPGYWKKPELTAKFFDEEGYLKTGDAVRFVDSQRPERGLLFDGRLAEDFKLSTGTWVHVGALRLNAIAALSPVAQDVVVTGHDRDEVGFLIFPNLAACRSLCSELRSDAGVAEVLRHAAVRARVTAGLAALSQSGGGSSTYATRALLLAEPPSIDAGEITDKGYINQGAVLSRRAAAIQGLYDSPPDPSVLTLSRPARATTHDARSIRAE